MRERIDGWLNPILVKELRQAVRGRFIVTVISLSLLAQLVAVGGFMLSDTIDSNRMVLNPVGAQTFTTLFLVLFTATVLFIPLYSGIRMAVERSDTAVDLLFVTTIRPRTIVFGKVLTSIALTALVFFASLPFLVFSYVLRGIDVTVIAVVLALGFLLVCSASILALFLGCLPATKPFRLLLAAAYLAFVLVAFAGLATILASMVQSSGRLLADPSFWSGVGSFAGFLLVLDAMLLILTTALVMPPAANRALPIRAMMTAVWALSLAASARAVFVSRDTTVMTIWAVTALVLITLVLCSAIGERESWGPRVARTIPRTPLRRALAFLFFSGGGGGVAWCIAMYAATVAAFAIVMHLRPPSLVASADPMPEIRAFGEAALIFLAYALTALALRRRFFAARIPAQATWAIALILFLLLAVAPPLVMISASDSKTSDLRERFAFWSMLNPFATVTGEDPHPFRMPLIGLWAVAAFAAVSPWLARQWRAFRPPGDDTPTELGLREAPAP